MPAAAVTVVERLQRVADPRAARPVGRGRGGRWIARSGFAAASARVRRVSRVAKTKASASRRAADRAASEIAGGARIRLHRARDVAQQDEPPRARSAGAGGASRIGSPPVRRLARRVRRISIAPAVASAPVAARRRCGVASSSAAPSAGRAPPARRARARRSACSAALVVAGQQRAPAGRSRPPTSSPRARGRRDRALAPGGRVLGARPGKSGS